MSLKKYLFFLYVVSSGLLIGSNTFAANMSGAECKLQFPGSDCDILGCFDGEIDHGACGAASHCCGPIASFSETTCENSVASGGQGGTCKVSNINGGCESGTQKAVGMCSDTLVDNACCVPLDKGGNVITSFNDTECEKAISNGGQGGSCVLASTCTDGKGTSVGACTEGAMGADRVCCVTEESKLAAEEESGVTQIGQVNIGTKYTPLEKIPFMEDATTFEGYVSGVYLVALILIVIASVFMLVIGGFTYLTSAGNTHQISSAKGIITGALIGLVLALASWLIINTINSDLTSPDVSTLQPLATRNGGTGGVSAGTGGSATSSLSAQEAARKLLAHPNVSLGTDSGRSCPGGNASSKQNLEQVVDGKGMTRCPCGGGGNVAPSETLLNSLVDLADAGARFKINYIAGACHSTGSNHYQGIAADLRRTSELDAFLDSKYEVVGSGPTYQVSGIKVWREPGKNGTPSDHYHVSPSGR